MGPRCCKSLTTIGGVKYRKRKPGEENEFNSEEENESFDHQRLHSKSLAKMFQEDKKKKKLKEYIIYFVKGSYEQKCTKRISKTMDRFELKP